MVVYQSLAPILQFVVTAFVHMHLVVQPCHSDGRRIPPKACNILLVDCSKLVHITSKVLLDNNDGCDVHLEETCALLLHVFPVGSEKLQFGYMC